MPRGYSGAPAIRYFYTCETAIKEAHAVVKKAAKIMPALPVPRLMPLPYSASDAAFSPGSTAGLENSTNIVGAARAYSNAANENRVFGENISERLQQILNRIDSIVRTDLRIPQTSVQVELVAQKLRLLMPDFGNILDRAANVTMRQADSMLSIAGVGAGLEVHRPSADSCRTETETCMRALVRDMREYAQQARNSADAIDARIVGLNNDLLRPPTSRTNTTVHNARLDQIRRDISRLSEEARNYRHEAFLIDAAARNLEQDIRLSGIVFETDCDECVACDTYYAGQFMQLALDMQQLAGKFQAIRDSFCPSQGITDWDALIKVKAGMSEADQTALLGLMVDAMLSQMMPGGRPNWDMIDSMLNKSFCDIADVQYTALGRVFVALDTSGRERFLNAMLTPIGNGTVTGVNRSGIFSLVTMYTICPEKLFRIHLNIDNAALRIREMQLELNNNDPNDTEIYDELNAERHDMIMGATILSVVRSEMAWREPFLQVVLGGDDYNGANGPITFTDRAVGGFELSFQSFPMPADWNPPAHADHRIVNHSIDPHILHFTQVLQNKGDHAYGAGAIVGITEAHFLSRHQWNPAQDILSGLVGMGISKATAGAWDVVEFGLDAAGIGVDMAINAAAAAGIRRDIMEITDNAWLALYASNSELDVIVVSGSSGVQAYTYPTRNSEMPFDLEAFRDRKDPLRQEASDEG